MATEEQKETLQEEVTTEETVETEETTDSEEVVEKLQKSYYKNKLKKVVFTPRMQLTKVVFLKQLQKWLSATTSALNSINMQNVQFSNQLLVHLSQRQILKAVNYLLELPGLKVIGVTQANPVIEWADQSISLKEIQATYEAPLNDIFPMHAPNGSGEAVAYIHDQHAKPRSTSLGAKPKVLIPVFPGTNCEFDAARAFERAGAETDNCSHS